MHAQAVIAPWFFTWVRRMGIAFSVGVLLACGGGGGVGDAGVGGGGTGGGAGGGTGGGGTAPPPVVVTMRLFPARVGLSAGGQGALRVLQAPGVVSWSSSNPAVAEVDNLGLVTARAAGSAQINAKAGAQTSSASITVHASTATSAVALIEQAQAQNRISAEQALIYRVFASVGDARLPAEFNGAPQAQADHLLMREVSGRLASLSQAGQDTLLPFLLPPIYAESWHAQQWGVGTAAARVASSAATMSSAPSATPLLTQQLMPQAAALRDGQVQPRLLNVNCAQADLPPIWRRRSTAHFNIYYLEPGANADLRAQNLSEVVAGVMEEVYMSLTDVLQRFPVSDLNLPCNGGDGAYDIYVLGWSPGGTVAQVTTYPGACKNSASYMALNSLHRYFDGAAAQPANSEHRRKVKSALAHEFMHALQFTINRSAACNEYTWIDEAIAQWAPDHVDPSYDQEDGFNKQTSAATRSGEHLLRYLSNDHMGSMEVPARDQSAADRGYAGYLFFQYLARRYSADTLRQILDAQTSHASIEAMAAALAAQGGMKAVWPDFAQTLWMGRTERELDYWRRTDRYDYGLSNLFNPAPGDSFAQSQSRLRSLTVEQAGRPRASFKLLENAHNYVNASYEVDPRSLYVEHLKFNDASVHSVMLINPIAILPAHSFMKLQAVKKIGGVWKAVEDWTEDSSKSFCLDKKDERLEELILIVSNSEANRGTEQPFRIPELFPMRLSTSNVGCWRWSGTASTTERYDDGITFRTTINGNGTVRWDVVAALPGALHLEPRAGFIDGSASGQRGGCTFTEVFDRKLAGTGLVPDGRLYINLDLELGLGESPNRDLTAFDGLAGTRSTSTLTCPDITTSGTSASGITWLKVDTESTYRVSADGQRIEGEYVATHPITRTLINTQFKFTAERE